jgi:hypothetical protein
MDHFGLMPEQFGRLTDRQIGELCFHARNEDGSIRIPSSPTPEPPSAPEGYETDLTQLAALLAMGVITRENHDACKEQLKVKYGRDE